MLRVGTVVNTADAGKYNLWLPMFRTMDGDADNRPLIGKFTGDADDIKGDIVTVAGDAFKARPGNGSPPARPGACPRAGSEGAVGTFAVRRGRRLVRPDRGFYLGCGRSARDRCTQCAADGTPSVSVTT
jgi:hypothetical protein